MPFYVIQVNFQCEEWSTEPKKEIRQFWFHGKSLLLTFQECRTSVVVNGHSFHFYPINAGVP